MFEMLNERLSRFWYGIGMEGVRRLRDCKGQGTTEYAILVGVLVVVAIIAVVAFRGKLQELWDGIAGAVNSL
jgi:Flp pilus assembly pilin Flp